MDIQHSGYTPGYSRVVDAKIQIKKSRGGHFQYSSGWHEHNIPLITLAIE